MRMIPNKSIRQRKEGARLPRRPGGAGALLEPGARAGRGAYCSIVAIL